MTKFHYLKWEEDGFSKWNLVRIKTIGDGNCLFHSIISAFSKKYKDLDHKKEKKELVKKVRRELADKLSERTSYNGPTYYDVLNYGNTKNFSKVVKDLSLSSMVSTLKSNAFIGFGYIEHLSNHLMKDVYILHYERQDIYFTNMEELSIKGRESVVICYINENHYETVGILNREGELETHFSPSHSLIKFLRRRVKFHKGLISN